MTALEEAIGELAPISLRELDSTAALMSRVDRKYFVPREVLARLLAEAGSGMRVLEIDGIRSFRYRTVYFDSPSFEFFRQHVQRRRHRFKVRTRLYAESGDCRLEVKSKGLRELTVKQRIAHEPERRRLLDPSARDYIRSITRTGADELEPVLETVYRRMTLTDGEHRITLDIDLEWLAGEQRISGPAEVLVETKSAGRSASLDQLLMRHGIRPHTVSKYCLAASMLYPHLRGNDWKRIRRRYWPAG